MKEKPAALDWSPRVPKWKITRIYEEDAKGIHDADLLNDVAYILFSRCKDILLVDEARNGRATCPVCKAAIQHPVQKEHLLSCPECAWTGTWQAYRQSLDGKHLIAPGIVPFCKEYLRQLPLAISPRKQMGWIDWLIHRCHWEGTALPGQPGAASLIQGRAQDVNAFLDDLTAGTNRSNAPENLGDLWNEKQKAQIRKWHKAAERRKRKNELHS